MAAIQLINQLGGSPTTGGVWSIEHALDSGGAPLGLGDQWFINVDAAVLCGPALSTVNTALDSGGYAVEVDFDEMRPGEYKFIYSVDGGACGNADSNLIVTVKDTLYAWNVSSNVNTEAICNVCGAINGGGDIEFSVTASSSFAASGQCGYTLPLFPYDGVLAVNWLNAALWPVSTANPFVLPNVWINNPDKRPTSVIINGDGCGPQMIPITWAFYEICSNVIPSGLICWVEGSGQTVDLGGYAGASSQGTNFCWYYTGKTPYGGAYTPAGPTLLGCGAIPTFSLLWTIPDPGTSGGDIYHFSFVAENSNADPSCNTHSSNVELTIELTNPSIPLAGELWDCL